MGRRKNKNHWSLPSLNQMPKWRFLEFLSQFWVANVSIQIPSPAAVTWPLILHESLNWVLLFLMAAPETGNTMWRTGKNERWQDLSAVVPVINMPEVKSAVKIWLPHPHQYTLIQVKKVLSTYFSWNKRHGTGSLCKPLLQLYTKWGWRGIRAGCQLPGWGVRASDRTEVKE